MLDCFSPRLANTAHVICLLFRIASVQLVSHSKECLRNGTNSKTSPKLWNYGMPTHQDVMNTRNDRSICKPLPSTPIDKPFILRVRPSNSVSRNACGQAILRNCGNSTRWKWRKMFQDKLDCLLSRLDEIFTSCLSHRSIKVSYCCLHPTNVVSVEERFKQWRTQILQRKQR